MLLLFFIGINELPTVGCPRSFLARNDKLLIFDDFLKAKVVIIGKYVQPNKLSSRLLRSTKQ